MLYNVSMYSAYLHTGVGVEHVVFSDTSSSYIFAFLFVLRRTSGDSQRAVESREGHCMERWEYGM